MNPKTEAVPEKYNTVKIVIFTVVIVCILILVYYLYCHYACDDEDGGAGVSVGWNIEEMVERIHNRQKNNLSRLSKNSHYNI